MYIVLPVQTEFNSVKYELNHWIVLKDFSLVFFNQKQINNYNKSRLRVEKILQLRENLLT